MKREELRALLAEAGITPSKQKGQNFLVEENLATAIARDGEIEPEDVVLEVGTGLGILTSRLVALAHHVVSVEKDARVLAVARRLLPAGERLTLVEADALATKNALNPEVLEVVRARLAEPPEGLGSQPASGVGAKPSQEPFRRLRVVANLPYSVATPLVVGFLEADLPLAAMTVMVQLEVAERFAAERGDPAYGAVSVLVGALCERVQIVRKVPPDVFHPRPKVSSAVVRFTPRPARREGVEALSEVVRALFNYRRKTLAKAAKAVARRDPGLAWLQEAIATSGLDPTLRPEDLDVAGFQALAARPEVKR